MARSPRFAAVLLSTCLIFAAGPSIVRADDSAAAPEARWTLWKKKAGHQAWEQSALSALSGHASALVEYVPTDIQNWCPGYPMADRKDRRAFWLAFLSALAKHESTYRQTAIGGDGRWHGLLQISPGTARGYGCAARSGSALRKGGANLNCALRIMAVTVPRDGVVAAKGSRWLGVAADWGPLRSQTKRAEMAAHTRSIGPCRMQSSLRPKLPPIRN